jgi:hypothetical protein
MVSEIEAHRAGTMLKDDVTIVVGKLQGLDAADVILGDATPGTMEALARFGLRVQGHLTGDGALAAIRPERPTLFVQTVPKGPPTGDLAATAAEARRRCATLTTAWMTAESFEQVMPLVSETPTAVHIFGLNPDLDIMELSAVARSGSWRRGA